MSIFFNDRPKNVSKDDFQKVRRELSSHDFNEKELDTVETFFSSSLYEDRDKDKGIDREEIENGIQTLRDNHEIYHLSPAKIDIVEEKLKKYL
ncbi:MAG: hypothetical protein JWL80_177 [Parcubacteria group bacterium]|nr:hypothetical protein [Parcubacteria group bacterium]